MVQFFFWLIALVAVIIPHCAEASDLKELASLIDSPRGIVVVAAEEDVAAEELLNLLKRTEWTIFFQSNHLATVQNLRAIAAKANALGQRIYIHHGPWKTIPLSHNLADACWVSDKAASQLDESEVLRVLRPLGRARIGAQVVSKPIPDGVEDWSHPYHGPDNNTQSQDQTVRGDFQTQFIGFPMFSPMPEQSVIAGGRIYKAMGNIAHKANQNEMLNTLLCINAYNGTILWRRELPPGFMIHRNTMVATDDGLYMGDHQSCKVFDALTGQLRREIKVDLAISDGPVWKWMGMQGDTLYALVGNPEIEIRTLRSDRPGIGHWPWGMWDGHDYNDPKTAFGHGRTLIAVDRNSGELKWHYRDEHFLDARGLCMKGNKLYAYSPEKFLLCIDTQNGQPLWRNSDEDLLQAIGPNEKAQHYVTGYATTSYVKCNDDYLFFAGPQRQRMVVASTSDGKLQWTKPVGNLQLVLRPEAIYAAGPERTRGMLLNYQTGSEIAELPPRRACTRATGCADSIFFRATGGTVRIMAATPEQPISSRHIAPMRPPCQDGVLVSNGHLYWGPWMCGCQLSLYGNIGLRPLGEEVVAVRTPQLAEQQHLLVHSMERPRRLDIKAEDWPTYQANNGRSSQSLAKAPQKVAQAWSRQILTSDLPTAPVAAGGLVFVADRSGAVRCMDADGQTIWTAYTSGPIYFPPAVAHDRLFVGSADGRVYAFEAASGNSLWSYHVGPNDRRISVFDKIVSRWPVSGGVAVEGNRVYAAAGLTHYDGTHVVALNPFTGKPESMNDTSGELSDQVHSGVSMQGEISIVDNEVRFAGGGIYEVARYRTDDLTCMNEPLHQLSSQYRTAFYAWYPTYNKYVSLEHALTDGRVLSFDANYDGSYFENLTLEPPRQLGLHGKPQKDLAGEFLRRRGREVPANLWRDAQLRLFTAFAVCDDILLGAGHSEENPDKPFLVAIKIDSGETLWQQDLPADTVKGGLAIDSQQRIYVTLDNGQLICFKAAP